MTALGSLVRADPSVGCFALNGDPRHMLRTVGRVGKIVYWSSDVPSCRNLTSCFFFFHSIGLVAARPPGVRTEVQYGLKVYKDNQQATRSSASAPFASFQIAFAISISKVAHEVRAAAVWLVVPIFQPRVASAGVDLKMWLDCTEI